MTQLSKVWQFFVILIIAIIAWFAEKYNGTK